MGEERDKNSLEEEPNQSLGDATESVETGPKYVLTEWLNEDLFKIGGMELVQVSHFFDGLICDLGCEDSPLFENKEVREDLLERLTEFSYYVNEEIKYMKTTLKGNEQYAKFSKDWVGHLTKAAYYAFFIHYGAKRKAEKDVNTQEPRDYVHHVMRSGFNCLIRKMRFFDEKTLLLCILHDTREDFDKGFLGLVHMDEEIKPGEYSSKDFQKRFKSARTKTVEKKDKIFDAFSRMENDLDRFSNKRELSLSKLVILMTKTTGDRNEAIVDLFYGIMSIEDPYERFSAFRAVMGKIADRLDNIKSLVVNLGKENEIVHAKEEIISDETWYLFLSLAKIFKMTNVAEWFYEYFYFKDLGERERRGEERATAHFVMRKKVTEKMGERRVEDYLLGDDSSGPEVEYDPNNPNDAAMLWEKNVGIYESNFYL